MSPLEKKLVEKHMFRNDLLKYSKATIDEKFGKKEFKVLFISPNVKETKILQEHLMLFELETNKDDL